MEKDSGYPLGCDGLFGGTENYPLYKAMVNHDQQEIETGGDEEVSDEVTEDLLEGVGCMGFDQHEWGDNGTCVRLILLAYSAALYILLHKLHKTWLPKFESDKLAGFKIPEVTGSLMVVAMSEDGTMMSYPQNHVKVQLQISTLMAINSRALLPS